MTDAPPPELLEMIGNLSEFHREHEKFYAQAPLRQAVEVQAASRVLKALADHWSSVSPTDRPGASPFAGAPDLNPPGLTAEAGVLFMEGEGEPAEIKQLRRDLETLAGDMEASGEWLSAAMEKGWAVAGSLAAYPELADLLGERHRIIANDWQSADEQALIARLLRRALEIIGRVDFSPGGAARAISRVSGPPRPTSTRPRSCSTAPPTWPCNRRRWCTTTSGVGAPSANESVSSRDRIRTDSGQHEAQ